MNKDLSLINNISRGLILVGYIITALLTPFIGIIFFIPSFILSIKRSDKDMAYNFLGSIICLVASFIYIILMIITSL